MADFLQPPYTILGAQDPSHLAALRDLYKQTPDKVFETSISVAEMVKYLSNAFHAVKVTFANEVGTLCKHLGVDAQAVTDIFTSDTRLNISRAYLSPGFAFGGSCLPKDVRALTYKAKELDLKLPLLESLLPSNSEHVERAVEAVMRTNKRKIAHCITQALLAFVDNHHDMGQFKELFKDYMSSDEGRELMKNMMKEVLLDVLSHQKIDPKDAKGNS